MPGAGAPVQAGAVLHEELADPAGVKLMRQTLYPQIISLSMKSGLNGIPRLWGAVIPGASGGLSGGFQGAPSPQRGHESVVVDRGAQAAEADHDANHTCHIERAQQNAQT